MTNTTINPLPYPFLQEDFDYTAAIRRELDNCLTETDLGIGTRVAGKVRDTYDLGDRLVLITTDRQSAFDRVLASIPFKGQALNVTSAWWFEQTKDIVDNHVIRIPDPNVLVARKCQVFPIEMVVRGYITGTTSTSLWMHYNNGVRNYCGNPLPDGLEKNAVLEQPILTPTTKHEEHDRPISPDEIISEGWLSREDWEAASAYALELFAFGQQVAREHGLILVDTKYEFGKDAAGDILLIDEIHTPDSSRYWIAEGYEERFARGEEPDNIDKEFLRLWFAENCDPYNDPTLPPAPDALRIELSRRYILLYELITGEAFQFPAAGQPVPERIRDSLAAGL
ncbi:MAG: phosphoribosylaminoimidazolesuccinocarboxamide synthase [Fidelibacterota bacterium]|nr:MAG: phosphoribosylaminoimidazolesuccinocarboxamide synthase [Candidatus Neomarinimicrobiota bacterium]